MTWLSEWWSGGTAVIEPANQRDAARLAQLHGASFHRGWGEGEFEVMLTERNTLVHRLRRGRKIIGFAVSRRAADEAELLSIAIDARHDHVYFQVVGGDGSSLIKPKVAPIAEALDAARFGTPHLVGNAAKILADRWPADATPPFKVDQQAAPDIAWVAWLGAAVNPESSPARPYYLRAPDAKPPKDPLSGAAQPPASR